MKAGLVSLAAVIVAAVMVQQRGGFEWALRHMAQQRQDDSLDGAVLPENVFSAASLREHDGTDPDKPLLLCVLGEVFDVSSGAKFYGKGEGYNIFLGQDASRSFHTGDWQNVRADVADLNVMAISEVVGWRNFYRRHKTYRRIGVMHGLYFNPDGSPTEMLAAVEAKAAEATAIQDEEDARSKRFPGCDMMYNASEKRTRIACPGDGEARYPRLLTWTHRGTGKEAKRCACFTGRELSQGTEAAYPPTTGAVLDVYAGCSPSDRECIVIQNL